MGSLDRDYLERRRDACLANAERAATPMIAKIHRDFAEHYAKQLEATAPRPMSAVRSAG